MRSETLGKIRQLFFINLTNGIEFVDSLDSVCGLVRIQSTACEQKRWWPIIADLDYTFLFAVALGHDVVICDASSKREVPRSLWQGVEWIRYTLNRRWLDLEINPVVRGHSCLDYFRDCFFKSGEGRRQALRKLDYTAKLCNPKRVSIKVRSSRTNLDGKYEEFARMLSSGGVYGKRQKICEVL